jgi:hypothetical protein
MYLKFKNLSVRGIGSHALEFQGQRRDFSDHLHIEGVDVDGAGGFGIEAQYFSDVNIIDCNVTRCMNMGILLDQGHRNFVSRCTISKTVGTNLKLSDQNDVVALGCDLWGIHGGHGNGMSIYGSWDEDANGLWVDWTQNACIAKNTFHNCNSSMNYARDIHFYANLYDIDPDGGTVLGIEPHSSTYNGNVSVINNTILSNYSSYTGIAYVFDPNTDVVNNYLTNNVIYRLGQQWDYNHYSWTSLPAGEWARKSIRSPLGHRVNGEYVNCTIPVRTHNSYIGYLFTQSARENWVLGTGERDDRSTDLRRMFVDPTYASGNWRPLPGGPLDGRGGDIAALIDSLGLATRFPEVDFTTDINGDPWGEPPSIGCYAGSGTNGWLNQSK